MGRWLLGALIILLVAVGYSVMTGDARIQNMQSNIRADLDNADHEWASVSMNGNEATIGGTAPSASAQAAVINIAKDSFCSACGDKHRWHVVKDETDLVEIAPLPTQSPYMFSARKSIDGSVVLDGFVPSETDRVNVLQSAVATFGNDQVTDSLQLADGAPDNNWMDVIRLYLPKLAQLDEGRLMLEDFEGSLIGKSTSADVQTSLYSRMQDGTPASYNFVGNVTVPDTPVEVVGQSGSQAICQAMMNDLRQGRKIGFASGEAVIRGDENFDLLGELASAAQQCPSFRIAINGYTSSDGADDLNQRLSEARANAVLFYLNEQGGIDLSRLSARGFGAQNPIASNDTVEGRELNRRIEFILSRAE